MTRIQLLIGIVLFAALGNCPLAAQAAEMTAASHGLTIGIDPATGAYQVKATDPAWTLSGQFPSAATQAHTQHGADAVGPYQEIVFDWTDGGLPLTGHMRLYDQKPLALFSETCRAATATAPAPFPDFHTYPAALHHFSYRSGTFAPAAFSLQNTSTPWLLFDDQDNALILSPASHFQIASLTTESGQALASGMNPDLRDLPAGFTQQTLLTITHGINHAWDVWGQALTDLGGKTRPANDSDAILKYFGYWTDNGATYYYNYDATLGYAGTLAALTDHYRQAEIPLHYLQLDSWWYEKSLASPDGHIGLPKNPKLPEGEWNRYGGLLDYTADKFLFPSGLAAYHQTVGLPFVTHNRWIDVNSPYRQHYDISGIAAVDPKWWDDITAYLKSSGVITYEQDWLDNIYRYSPDFSRTVGTADAFMDNMARACAAHGLDMQYCMALPCDFLQGSRYANLTSIRASGDRFDRGKWRDFLYTSRLASAVGVWPWTDVFDSTERNNLLLSDLSAGPVGVGDAIGQESRDNIFQVIRADGVIVKPDTALAPMDQSYLADAQDASGPLLASAETDQDGWKAAYVFAFTRSATAARTIRFTPAEAGIAGPAYVYDAFAHTGQRVSAGMPFTATLNDADGTGYYIVVPYGRSGIAFLGDSGKFVSAGRARIPAVIDQPGKLTASVAFAPSETAVTLRGCAPAAPHVFVASGTADPVHYDPATSLFDVTIHPAATPGSGATRIARVTLRS